MPSKIISEDMKQYQALEITSGDQPQLDVISFTHLPKQKHSI